MPCRVRTAHDEHTDASTKPPQGCSGNASPSTMNRVHHRPRPGRARSTGAAAADVSLPGHQRRCRRRHHRRPHRRVAAPLLQPRQRSQPAQSVSASPLHACAAASTTACHPARAIQRVPSATCHPPPPAIHCRLSPTACHPPPPAIHRRLPSTACHPPPPATHRLHTTTRTQAGSGVSSCGVCCAPPATFCSPPAASAA